MKIIGETTYGYIVEIDVAELSSITGNPKDDSHRYQSRGSYGNRDAESHPIGTEFHVGNTWDHLQSLLENEPQRKKIAESLRAAATLIEHTPSPLTLPQPEVSASE